MSMMPDIRDVDFDDIEDVIGYVMLIIAESNEFGLFTMNCSKQSSETIELKTIAQKWINTVQQLLMTIPLGEGLCLLNTYDIIHTLAYDMPGGSRNLSAYKLRAFEVYLHQDKIIDQHDLYNAINAELRRHNPLFIDDVATLALSLNLLNDSCITLSILVERYNVDRVMAKYPQARQSA